MRESMFFGRTIGSSLSRHQEAGSTAELAGAWGAESVLALHKTGRWERLASLLDPPLGI
jgi:hypothetical protein